MNALGNRAIIANALKNCFVFFFKAKALGKIQYYLYFANPPGIGQHMFLNRQASTVEIDAHVTGSHAHRSDDAGTQRHAE